MGANDKAAATYHPRIFECSWCEHEWESADAAKACCSEDWLGYD
jgi:hypothetical protein